MRNNRTLAMVWGAAIGGLVASAPALAIDDAHKEKAAKMADKAAEFLRSKQDKTQGGWAIPAKGPHTPAISALVINGLAMDPAAKNDDPVVASGVQYLLRFQQPDGGIYDKTLPSYNTSISLSALSKVNTPEARAAARKAQEFLRRLQWSEDKDNRVGGADASEAVPKEHVFYGGVGYGNNGRPDNSNLSFMMQAMQDSGVSPDDPCVQRALVFLRRTQMHEAVNDMPYAKGSHQGGFIYSTDEQARSVDDRGQPAGASQAGTIEESLDDGTKVSRLRAYGSMTYAGFKTLVYAQLPRDDKRVVVALDWIRHNYTLEENPGMGKDGMYYYYLAFARALGAWGQEKIEAFDPDGKPRPHDWANDLIDRLATLQNEDGSFKSQGNRWMEKDPVLITAYALIALRTASPG